MSGLGISKAKGTVLPKRMPQVSYVCYVILGLRHV